MSDFTDHLDLIERQTGEAGKARTVTLRRSYDAAIEDVWEAITDPDRIKRWFLPVNGDLRVGGRFQTEGNAGGEILVCDAPTLLKVTWVMGELGEGEFSEVAIRLSAKGSATVFELEHTATVDPNMWGQFGPGAVGVGWDLTLLGLGLYLATGSSVEDPEAWQVSAEGRACVTHSSKLWGEAHRASGADEETVATAVANTTQFYAPAPE